MKYCKQCGSMVDEEAKFCMNCGCALSVETPAADTVKEAVTEPVEPVQEAVKEPVQEAAEEPVQAAVEETVQDVQEIAADNTEAVQETVAEPIEVVQDNAEAAENVQEEVTPVAVPVMNNTYEQPAAPTVVVDDTPEASVQEAQPVQAGAPAPRAPGKSIAGFILGICALVNGALGAIFAFFSLIPTVSIVMMVCAITFGIIAIACAIPGIILSRSARKIEPGNKFARLGWGFSFAGIITGGFAVVFGIIFGVIGIMYLMSSLYRY